MYKVIKSFFDLQDKERLYSVGDTFPHGDLKVSADRLKELSTKANKLGTPLIRKVAEKRNKE